MTSRPDWHLPMPRLRHACAWTLLAVFAIGGTVAPDVHRVVHGLERAAVLAAHTHDGHHGQLGTGDWAREACATTPAGDTACALCQGTSASLVAQTTSVEVPVATGATRRGALWNGTSARLEAPTGRGPPETVA